MKIVERAKRQIQGDGGVGGIGQGEARRDLAENLIKVIKVDEAGTTADQRVDHFPAGAAAEVSDDQHTEGAFLAHATRGGGGGSE